MDQNKIVKGKRPEFYSAAGVDYLMHMVMVLAEEHSAMRDRLDKLENIAAEKGLFTDDDIESHVPPQASLERREATRQQFLSNLFSVMYQEAAEIDKADTKERFASVITELATNT